MTTNSATNPKLITGVESDDVLWIHMKKGEYKKWQKIEQDKDETKKS